MTSLAVRGGAIVAEARVVRGDVTVAGSSISSITAPSTEHALHVVDATGCFVLPGFVDLQVNGAVGVDLTSEPERIGEVAAFLVQCGVTSFMPTVISCSLATANKAVATMHAWALSMRSGARSLGVHLEGPFLNPTRAGAHPPHHLRLPSTAEAMGWRHDSGVAMVTIAPELPGALAVIRQLVADGVSVCAGHTAADPVQMSAAAAAGVRGVTHLFNAMGSISARMPGPAGATLGDPVLLAGLIVDGIHVDPTMVRIAWRALGPNRIVLVTDSIAALGRPEGSYSIGDTQVMVKGGAARSADGMLAGSVLRFDQAVRNLIAFTGCELAEASISASTTPAGLAGRAFIGRLAPGCEADIVVLDAENTVVVTIVGGRVVFDPQQRCSGP